MQAQEARVALLERFAWGMADIRVSRHPLRRDVLVVLNEVEKDRFQDTDTVERGRVYKQAIVRKNPDMHYLQDSFGADLLVEDGDILPWLISFTMTGLPRLPHLDDYIIVDGIKYAVAMVKPMNRDLGGLVQCMIYPERSEEMIDPLAIYSVSFRDGLVPVSRTAAYGQTVIMDVLWGGYPLQMSFNKMLWQEFHPSSRVLVPGGARYLYVKDGTDRVVSHRL